MLFSITSWHVTTWNNIKHTQCHKDQSSMQIDLNRSRTKSKSLCFPLQIHVVLPTDITVVWRYHYCSWKKVVLFQRTLSSVSMANHQWLLSMIIFRILGWTSGTNFIDKKNVWKHCQCIKQRWKNILKRWENIWKRWKQLLAFEGKRCKCVENHWNLFQCIVTHSKCVEMLFNANFVKPGFPK